MSTDLRGLLQKDAFSCQKPFLAVGVRSLTSSIVQGPLVRLYSNMQSVLRCAMNRDLSNGIRKDRHDWSILMQASTQKGQSHQRHCKKQRCSSKRAGHSRSSIVCSVAAPEKEASRPQRLHSDDPSTDVLYDAVIIGSGMGGLATATQLASNGAKVVVLEK